MRNQRSMPYYVVFVDQHDLLVEATRSALEREGFYVSLANTGEQALSMISSDGVPDLIIAGAELDTRMTGFELCRKVHRFSDVPIIMTTNSTDPETAVYALESLAEDFITKPYDVPVLVARARRLVRRFSGKFRNHTRLKMDFVRRQLSFQGQTVKLTPNEAKLLHIFSRHTGEIIPCEYLVRRMWPENRRESANLRVTVYRLRNKLGKAAGMPDLIRSERGIGYRFVPHSIVS